MKINKFGIGDTLYYCNDHNVVVELKVVGITLDITLDHVVVGYYSSEEFHPILEEFCSLNAIDVTPSAKEIVESYFDHEIDLYDSSLKENYVLDILERLAPWLKTEKGEN